MKSSVLARHKKFAGRSVAVGIVIFLAGGSTALAAGIKVIPDSSVFIQVVNFLFLIFALNIIVYKPIRRIVSERKGKIEGLEKSIQGLDKEAGEKDQAYGDGIAEARAKGFAEKEALIQAASDEEKNIVDEITSKAQAELTVVREKITKDVDDVRESLQGEIDVFAREIGRKILGRAV